MSVKHALWDCRENTSLWFDQTTSKSSLYSWQAWHKSQNDKQLEQKVCTDPQTSSMSTTPKHHTYTWLKTRSDQRSNPKSTPRVLCKCNHKFHSESLVDYRQYSRNESSTVSANNTVYNRVSKSGIKLDGWVYQLYHAVKRAQVWMQIRLFTSQVT